ncbi:MAG TPA: hemin uptake protein HemP [bacterium]|nr:hemin uptake protein HemP [bacterium]
MKPETVLPAIPAEIIKSEELFQGRKQIVIVHHDKVYRLTITKTGKLILNR